MSRKKSQRKTARRPKRTAPPLSHILVESFFGVPRIARMVIVAVFALAVTMVISPIVDRVYLQYFFTQETVIVPALITVIFGAVMYMLGWWLAVGPTFEEVQSHWLVLWYLALGFLSLILTVVLLIIGIAIGTELT
jgi:hypothetical protein